MATQWCSHCTDRPVWKRRLCRSCYAYQARTGEPRPLWLVVRARWRSEEDRQAKQAWPLGAPPRRL